MTIDSRVVAKQKIAQSFKGILRVSPNETSEGQIDNDLSSGLLHISDSNGNLTPLSLSTLEGNFSGDFNFDNNVNIIGKLSVNNDINANALSINNIKIDPTGSENKDILVFDGEKYSPQDILSYVTSFLVPVGTIVSYGGNTAPDGWLLCDGKSYRRNEYDKLFNIIGTNFGNNNNSTFKVPDLRNQFLRGSSNTRNIGTIQTSAAPNIKGDLFIWRRWNSENPTGAFAIKEPVITSQAGDGGGYNIMAVASDFNANRVSDIYQDNVNEIRPNNIAVNYIIKY